MQGMNGARGFDGVMCLVLVLWLVRFAASGLAACSMAIMRAAPALPGGCDPADSRLGCQQN